MLKNNDSSLVDELDIALRELGLSQTEIELYRLSLSTGPLPISDLANQLKLQRPYVYRLIESLESKGLVPKNIKKYQRSFVVESPAIILELLRKKRTNLENLTSQIASDLPRYLASYKQGGNATEVLFYEGRDKYLELYDRVLEEEGKETVFFGEAENFLSLVKGAHLQSWLEHRVKKGVKIRSLMIDSPLARTIPSLSVMDRQSRYLPANQTEHCPASFQVFGNNVIFWQTKRPLAVVLKDEYISKMHRFIFDLLWSGVKE